MSQCCLSDDKTVGFQTRSFTTPPKYDSARTQLEVEMRKILAFGQIRANENRCVRSFAVKCAQKCNLLRINATFVENKCNFLTFSLQQKLSLMITDQVCFERKPATGIQYGIRCKRPARCYAFKRRNVTSFTRAQIGCVECCEPYREGRKNYHLPFL